MSKQSSASIKNNLEISLQTVGDMALKRRARKIVEGLQLKTKNRILDIGCGNGYYLSLLNRMGINLYLTGIDIDQTALEDGKKFIGDSSVKLIHGDAAKLPFQDLSFDKIVMSEVIEHVQDEKKVLAESYRVLKRDGVLVLTTCNIDYPFFWDPVNWILQHFFNTHIKKGFWAGIWNQHDRLYQVTTIEGLIKNAGFKIEQSQILTSWCLPFNHYFLNLIAKLFYLNKLPKNIAQGMNKFKNNRQSWLVKLVFNFVNWVDYLNDLLPAREVGVSIFIKAYKS